MHKYGLSSVISGTVQRIVRTETRAGGPLASSHHRGSFSQYGLAAVLLYGALAALFAPFTWPAQAAAVLPCLIIIGLAVRREWLKPFATARAPRLRIGLLVWAAVFAVMVAFQLLNFFEWPRSVYPTLSSLLSNVFALYPVRALAFGLWIWLGWYVVDR